MALISAENHFAVFAAIMGIAASAFLLEKTRVGRQLTGAVLAILIAIAAANLGVIPHDAPAYGFVFTYIVPTLIPLFLFQADLKRLVREASRTSLAFAVACLGTVAGVIVAALLLDLSALGTGADIGSDQREAAIVGLFASTYTGGSVNYAALGEITGLNQDRSFFSAATAADNLFSAVYLSVIALIPATRWIAASFARRQENLSAPDKVRQVDQVSEQHTETSAASLCLSIAAAVGLVAISDALVALTGLGDWRYMILTALTLAVATFVPGARRWFSGSFEMGVALSFAFFAAIAAGANVAAMISVAPLLIVLVAILLSVHLVVLLSLGWLLKLTIPELLTASNAAILGATTAPAMAAAKGWHDQVTPGVLVGVVGYAVGTFIGTALFQLW